jgi:thymidylate synthase (FAD)
MIREGCCPEQARFVLPQGCEVNWVWTGSLYAFANAYNQRSDSHAQKEVQDLFAQVDEIIAPLYPVSWRALTRGEY